MYFNKIKSSRIAPFRLIEPDKEGVLIITLLERVIISSFDFKIWEVTLSSLSIDVAGWICSLTSLTLFFIGAFWGNNNWKATIIAMDNPIARNKFFCSPIKFPL